MIQDQEYRDIARRILDHNIVVEAGAGTGKTSLLTDRLLFLLLAGAKNGKGLDISRVAAVTFTEKAAGEIKARLSSRLSRITRGTREARSVCSSSEGELSAGFIGRAL